MAKAPIRQDDLARLRDRAQADVLEHLFQLANELVRPFLHRYGVGLWHPETLEPTPEARAVITALVELPSDPDELPEELVSVAMHRIIDCLLEGAEPPEKPPELSTPQDILRPMNLNVPEGLIPDGMLDRYRVPPYEEAARNSWAARIRPEEGGCWRWVGKYVNPNRTTPMFSYRGDQYNARRSGIWLSNLNYTIRRSLPTVCGRSDCVNPEHLEKENEK